MKKETKKGRRRTKGVDRDLAAKVRADDPKRSLDRLEELTRRVLHVQEDQSRTDPA